MKHILAPIGATILAAIVANCNEGCGGVSISPADAYAMELSACAAKRDAKVIQCAEEAGSKAESQECRAQAEDDYIGCRNLVDHKYGLYNANGSYPTTSGQ